MYAPVGLLAVGLLFGILTLTTVVGSPQFSLAASVTGGPVVLLATAWLCVLTATAQLYWGDRRLRLPAVLLALAGLAWLIPEWDNPRRRALPVRRRDPARRDFTRPSPPRRRSATRDAP